LPVGIDRQLPHELFRHLDLGRILVCDGESLDRTLLVDDVDHAPVGEGRNHEGGDVRESGLVVERRGELLTRLGNQPAILCQSSLLVVHRRGAQRCGGEARYRTGLPQLRLAERPRSARVEHERADHLATMAQGHSQERTRSLGSMRGLVLDRQPVGRCDVLCNDRAIERDDVPIALDRTGRSREVGVGEPRARLQRPALVDRVVPPDCVGIRRERRLGKRQDVGEDGVEVQRAE
jgi:hypothetical protein